MNKKSDTRDICINQSDRPCRTTLWILAGCQWWAISLKAVFYADNNKKYKLQYLGN